MSTGNPEFLVLRMDDIREFLGPEWHESLLQVQQVIEQGRKGKGKPVDDVFMVLPLRDRFARAAMDGYIQAIDHDPNATNHPGAQAARLKMFQLRSMGLLKFTPTLPEAPAA